MVLIRQSGDQELNDWQEDGLPNSTDLPSSNRIINQHPPLPPSSQTPAIRLLLAFNLIPILLHHRNVIVGTVPNNYLHRAMCDRAYSWHKDNTVTKASLKPTRKRWPDASPTAGCQAGLDDIITSAIGSPQRSMRHLSI